MRRCLRPGCPNAAKPKGDYCRDACRAAAHKLRVRSGELLPREAKRLHDREAKKAARAAGVIASDVRLSYETAVRALAAWLRENRVRAPGEDQALAMAEQALAPALPERLRPGAVGDG